jgi:hypothetical protein
MLSVVRGLVGGRERGVQMVLCRLRGESYSEIGARLGVTKQAVHKDLKAWVGGSNPEAWQVIRRKWSLRGGLE